MTWFERALGHWRELGERRQESDVVTLLGLIAHHMGDDAVAREYGQQALHVAQDLGDGAAQGNAMMVLGHALAALGRLAEASDAYRQGVEQLVEAADAYRQEVDGLAAIGGVPWSVIECLAGLAGASLTQGDLVAAQAYVEEVLSHLETLPTLDGADEPFPIYLNCYCVLRANNDSRAGEVLDAAHRLLQERARRIEDVELRRSFLENVAAHREIVEEWASRQVAKSSDGQTDDCADREKRDAEEMDGQTDSPLYQ
jgi:tetratricopeptide (TPR) repeat protein